MEEHRNKQTKQQDLTADDFALLFGTSTEEVALHCDDLIRKGDFRYEIIAGKHKEQIIIQAEDRKVSFWFYHVICSN